MKKTLIVIAFFLFSHTVAATEKILLYAAASTSQAVTEIIKQFNQATPDIKVKVSFASSSTLAKQIEAGAPAHVYISANPKWMDYLQQRHLLVNSSRKDLLRNSLVLITPKNSSIAVTMDKNTPLVERLTGKLCLGDPSHVPVGMYAQQALKSLGWWQGVKPHIVGTKDVRAALTFVELGECAAGIVYATDANGSDKIQLIAGFPTESHEPIVYPVAKLATVKKSVDHFLEYLSSPKATAIFQKYGFYTQ